MNTIELIRTIIGRPGMYVDPESVDSIYFFVQGFYFCRRLHGLSDEQDELFRAHFYDLLKTAHQLEAAATWGDLLSAVVAREKARPIDVFAREFERFLQEHGIVPGSS